MCGACSRCRDWGWVLGVVQHVGCKGEEVEALLRRCRRLGGGCPGSQLITGGGVERILYLQGPSTQQEVQDVAAQATLSNRGVLRSIGDGRPGSQLIAGGGVERVLYLQGQTCNRRHKIY